MKKIEIHFELRMLNPYTADMLSLKFGPYKFDGWTFRIKHPGLELHWHSEPFKIKPSILIFYTTFSAN